MPIDYYIDLGTANTLIYSGQRGLLLNEPSVIASSYQGGRLKPFAVGKSAKSMLGRSHRKLVVQCPLRDGVVVDFDSTSQMVRGFISLVKEHKPWQKPRLTVSLPYCVTYHERQAVREIGIELGAREVKLLHEPVAAAIGLNLPIFDALGSMVVDIGGGTTEIVVMSAGGVVNAQGVRLGGTHIDEAIIRVLRKDCHFAIGQQTAELVKIAVASCVRGSSGYRQEVGGLDCARGLPVRRVIDSDMIFPAVDEVLRPIIQSIRNGLDACSPDILADIQASGLVVTGGGAFLLHLQERLQSELEIPVKIASDPLLSVARGGARILNQPASYTTLEVSVS